MRVGVFSPTMHRIGGAELVAINMINALKRQNYEVVVSSNKRINPTKVKEFYGKNVEIDAQIIFPFHLFPPYNHYNIYTLAVQSYILKLNCDVLIDSYGISPFPWSDITYFQGSKILRKSVLSIRNAPFLPYFKLLKPLVDLERRVILANSRFKARFLKKYIQQSDISAAPMPISVVYPPVATKFFRPSSSNLNKQRENVCMTVSRVSPEKRLEIIPRIAELTNKDISFIIVGSCHSRRTLYSLLGLIRRLKVEDRVKVLTDIPRNHLKSLLWNSKVYLHTMPDEAFGITIIEGMASGCTPIVHDSGGPKEFVPRSSRYKTAAEAACKIECAVSDWTSKRARKLSRFASRFDEEEFSRKFLSVVNSCIENRRAKRGYWN